MHVYHMKSGEDIAGSPFVLQVTISDEQTERMKAEAKRTLISLSVGVSMSVFVVAVAISFRIWRQGFAKVKAMQSQKIALEFSVLRQKQNLDNMESKVKDLNESLRNKKHTEEELRVMKDAMETMSRRSSDELRGVLVDSADVKILNMLGKGGFGVVHLGDFKGTLVAVKQLLSISPENVARFRFECFLMKNLRHPNIVRLVGVCWDSSMLACLLEYISNGSLEDHLKQDRSRALEHKMTWKDKLLKVAIQSATGVQYLHHSRYFDENAECWKDCIIHRDLKPDNILVTNEPEFMAKLTDFGEARATELNLQMTNVGTPIFIAPEILRNDRYDAKVDVYSYSIVLVAMLRAEKDVVTFFFEALRRDMKKKNKQGIGINILNNRMLNKGFRPPLPAEIYPSLGSLIKDCWRDDPALRPTFDEIVTRLSGVISLEVNSMQEPDVRVIGGHDLDQLPSASDRKHVVDDNFENSTNGLLNNDSTFHGEDSLVSMRRVLDEERAKLKMAEERTKLQEESLVRQLEEERRMRALLEERLRDFAAREENFPTLRMTGGGGGGV